MRFIICIVNFLACFSVCATDLMDIYQQALENDPVFKQAYSTYMANREALPQAWSSLLPQLALTGQTGRNYSNTTTFPVAVQGTFNGSLWQVSASQAVFNFQAWSAVKQAKSSVKQAQALFNDAAQNLILRTASAYLNILLAQDVFDFAKAKRRANKRQLAQAQERFNVGVDTITSVYEAKAGYDQSAAQVIQAHNNQINQNENLRKLTNHVYQQLAPLRNGRIPLIVPEPNRVDEWIYTGLKQNYRLFAAEYALIAAKENIKVQAAGNWPTFAIQGNTLQTNNDVNTANTGYSFFIPKRQISSNVLLAVNFPIVQGGLVASETRQARYQFQTVSQQLEQIRREVIVDSRTAFNSIIDGISKVRADRQTVVSRVNSLNSTDAQFEAGTRTMVDVVNAQQYLFDAQRELANDQYNLINAILRLKYLAGTLSVRDLEEINAWLKTTRFNKMAPNNLLKNR